MSLSANIMYHKISLSFTAGCTPIEFLPDILWYDCRAAMISELKNNQRINQQLFLCVCLFICEQDYAKSTEVICTKLGGGMGNGSGKNQSNFGADAGKGADIINESLRPSLFPFISLF